MNEKLQFVTDGFGVVRRYKVSSSRGRYLTIYLAPEVCKKEEETRTQAKVEEGGAVLPAAGRYCFAGLIDNRGGT